MWTQVHTSKGEKKKKCTPDLGLGTYFATEFLCNLQGESLRFTLPKHGSLKNTHPVVAGNSCFLWYGQGQAAWEEQL